MISFHNCFIVCSLLFPFKITDLNRPKARTMVTNSSDTDDADEEELVLCASHVSEETSIEVCDSASHMDVDSLYKCKTTCTSHLVLGAVPMKLA